MTMQIDPSDASGRGAAARPAHRRARRRGVPLRWFGRRRSDGREAPGTTQSLGAQHDGTDGLRISMRVERSGVAVVALSGSLVRQHAGVLDGSLEPVLAGDLPLYVIDLGGVTRLDPTALAAVTRCAEAIRGRGAGVTIVPPGGDRGRAA